jgi:dihydroflavonol-4-reductase
MMPTEQVLVTGGTGFVGAHCIAQLLARGYRVRTTVRSLSRQSDVLAMQHEAGADASALEVIAADLMDDAGWPAAVAGCAYVLHVASPFPVTQPKDENELIVPARDGALRVLRAARDAGVRRVVMTSSTGRSIRSTLTPGGNDAHRTGPGHRRHRIRRRTLHRATA